MSILAKLAMESLEQVHWKTARMSEALEPLPHEERLQDQVLSREKTTERGPRQCLQVSERRVARGWRQALLGGAER